MKVSADVGRSSVKFTSNYQVSSFPFLIATKQSRFVQGDYGGRNDLLIANVDGAELLFGDTARIAGDAVFPHIEGKAFMEASIQCILFSTATLMQMNGYSKNVFLAHNLTYQNLFLKSQYEKALIGSHVVKIYSLDKPFEFDIVRVATLPQGLSGFFEVAMDRNNRVLPTFRDTQGIVMDVGRQTVDFIYLDSMMVKDGSSIDFGTFKVFSHVADQLKSRYSIHKESYEIETLFRTKRKITLMGGEMVDIKPMVDEAVAYFASDMEKYFSIFNATKTPDYVVMIGGGAYLYGDYFKQKYRIVSIPDQPHIVNTIGMLKFLERVKA